MEIFKFILKVFEFFRRHYNSLAKTKKLYSYSLLLPKLVTSQTTGKRKLSAMVLCQRAMPIIWCAKGYSDMHAHCNRLIPNSLFWCNISDSCFLSFVYQPTNCRSRSSAFKSRFPLSGSCSLRLSGQLCKPQIRCNERKRTSQYVRAFVKASVRNFIGSQEMITIIDSVSCGLEWYVITAGYHAHIWVWKQFNRHKMEGNVCTRAQKGKQLCENSTHHSAFGGKGWHSDWLISSTCMQMWSSISEKQGSYSRDAVFRLRTLLYGIVNCFANFVGWGQGGVIEIGS